MDTSSTDTRFVFVGGSGRSGTTLIQKILCAHSAIGGGPEFDHLVPLMYLFRRMREPSNLARQSWFYSEDQLEARMRSFISSLFEGVRERTPQVQIIAEKTPANIDVAHLLLELFPDSRFIHVARDGRDVLLSHKKVRTRFLNEKGATAKTWMKEFSSRVVIDHWKRNIESARQIEEEAQADVRARFTTVRYEDLVSDPSITIENCCRFIGVAPESAMFAPERIDPHATGQIANIDNIWYTNEQFSQPFNTGSVGKWSQGLTLPERFISNLRMAPELSRLNYNVPAGYRALRGLIDRIRRRK